jgi:hypothetical protein
MDPILGVIFVLWCIKVFAEDGWSTVKGQSNPRMDRRKARQKSRAGNPIWTQFVGWLGDIAEDARAEQDRARKEKRERQAEARRKRELEEHETVDAEIVDQQDNEPVPPDPAPKHEELDVDDCHIPGCPIHHPATTPDPQPAEPKTNSTPDPSTTPNEGDDMSEINGLDQSIAYAAAVKSMAAKHGTAGNEGYIGHLTERNVTGEALQSAHDMQAAMSGAMAAAAHHESELLKQKAVQEQYDANADAGDKQFQTEGR